MPVFYVLITAFRWLIILFIIASLIQLVYVHTFMHVGFNMHVVLMRMCLHMLITALRWLVIRFVIDS